MILLSRSAALALLTTIAFFALALLPYTSTAQTAQVPSGLIPLNTGGAVVIDAEALGEQRPTGLGQANMPVAEPSC